MKTPAVYAAISTERGRPDLPCIRKEDGKEVALITLSSYRVGAEMSPAEWRDKIVHAVNTHDNNIAVMRRVVGYLEDGDTTYTVEELCAMLNHVIEKENALES